MKREKMMVSDKISALQKPKGLIEIVALHDAM